MFKWTEEYALGIEEIDDQHKRLFEIGNELYDLLSSANQYQSIYEEINAIVEDLRDYTVFHFRTEEIYFEKFHYENSEAHKKEHEDFVERLNHTDFQLNNEEQRRQAMYLLKMIIDWIFKHIHGSDFLYKDCFESNMGIN